MGVIGALLKQIVRLDGKFNKLPTDPERAQRDQLEFLLNEAKDTSFGLYYDFKGIINALDPPEEFRKRIPLIEYDDMYSRWWSQQENFPNITWPGMPGYFARTSGTTGKKSKKIPITDDVLKATQSVSRSQIASLVNFDMPQEFFEGKILMLSSSAQLDKQEGYEEGEISGINVSRMPSWFENFYAPGKEIAKIDNWNARIDAIVEHASEWNVTALAGIPSWVQLMLKAIIDHYKLDNIHDIWPNLMMYASGGVSFDQFFKPFDKLTGRKIHYVNTYLASEGYFAFTSRPGTMDMQLAIEHGIYFEFIPFNERNYENGNLLKDAHALHLGEVRKGEEYVLVVSSPAGAWRYVMGDTIKFTDLSKMEIKITGRTKYFMNIVGSQLSEEKLNEGIQHLSDAMKVNVQEFSISAVALEGGKYRHHWILGVDDICNEETAASILDEYFKKANNNYRRARYKALSEIQVTCVKTEAIYDYLEHMKKKGGQVKFPKVAPEDTFHEMYSFFKKQDILA